MRHCGFVDLLVIYCHESVRTESEVGGMRLQVRWDQWPYRNQAHGLIMRG
jgi:hypothetical protein